LPIKHRYIPNIKLKILIKNKKILVITECFYPEEFKINDLALSWKNKGFDVDVLTLEPTYPSGKVFPGYKNSFFRKDEYKGINIFRLLAITGYRNSVVKKIWKYINFMIFGTIVAIFIGRRYNYVFGFNVGPLTDMFPAVIIRKLYKKPVMFWVQDVWPDSVYAFGIKKNKILSTLLDFFVKFMFQNITAVAISSKRFELKLAPYIKKGLKFNFCPNWSDNLDMDVAPAILSKNQKIHLTFAGNVGKMQNLENVVNAFCLLSDKYQEKAQLNIFGNGSNLVNLKNLSNNNSQIVFHGFQAREDMAKFYKASDFLIISLKDDPIFSMTIPAKTQTYIAAKKPILAIINGDVADIVKDYNLGICADPSNVDLIKESFERCISMSKKERDGFIINNDKLSKTIFNKDSIINNLTNQLVTSGD